MLSVACVFAQVDSTYIPILTPIVNAAEGKYTWVAPAFMGLFLLSEILSMIPAVKSNGVFQLLFGWISFFSKKP